MFFRSGTLGTPRVVAAPPAESETEVAIVTPSFAEGSLLLKDAHGNVLRLTWEKRDGGEMPSDRRRAVPPGKYALVGYRIVDRSRMGEVWHVSASGPKIRTLDLGASTTTDVDVDATIHLLQRFDGRAIGMAIQGESEAGLTVYRDGRRIGVRYRAVDSSGSEVASGDMRYG